MGYGRHVRRLAAAIAILGALAGCANKNHLSGAEQRIYDARCKKGAVLSENEKSIRDVLKLLNLVRKQLIVLDNLIESKKRTTLRALKAELAEIKKILILLEAKGILLKGELIEVKRLQKIVDAETAKMQ